MPNDQCTSAGSTFKYKLTSGGTYTALVSVVNVEPGPIKLGVIPLKRPLQDTNRWRKNEPGDPSAEPVKVTCVWNHAEYKLVRDWIGNRTKGIYIEAQIQDEEEGSVWERIGFAMNLSEPKMVQNDEGGEEIGFDFDFCITGEPEFTEGETTP